MNLPIGVVVNSLAVLVGGFLGASLGSNIPERLRVSLPLTFGAASMGMGVSLIVKMHALPPVILSLLIGSAIGELLWLEHGITRLASKAHASIERVFPRGTTNQSSDFMETFVGIVVLFCASGTGIFGALNEGMTGDHSLLITKSFLDFFSASIFATTLGYLVMTIALPQVVILLVLFLSAGFILPVTTPDMIADFSGVGGIIMLVTGLRISGIKPFPVANMLPGLLIVMPLSYLWTQFI